MLRKRGKKKKKKRRRRKKKNPPAEVYVKCHTALFFIKHFTLKNMMLHQNTKQNFTLKIHPFTIHCKSVINASSKNYTL